MLHLRRHYSGPPSPHELDADAAGPERRAASAQPLDPYKVSMLFIFFIQKNAWKACSVSAAPRPLLVVHILFFYEKKNAWKAAASAQRLDRYYVSIYVCIYITIGKIDSTLVSIYVCIYITIGKIDSTLEPKFKNFGIVVGLHNALLSYKLLLTFPNGDLTIAIERSPLEQ